MTRSSSSRGGIWPSNDMEDIVSTSSKAESPPFDDSSENDNLVITEVASTAKSEEIEWYVSSRHSSESFVRCDMRRKRSRESVIQCILSSSDSTHTNTRKRERER